MWWTLRKLRSYDEGKTREAVRELVKDRSQAATEALAEALERHPFVPREAKLEAARALANREGCRDRLSRAVAVMLAGSFEESALAILAEIRLPAHIPYLVKEAESGRFRYPEHFAKALALTDDPRAVDALVGALSQGNSDVVKAARNALAPHIPKLGPGQRAWLAMANGDVRRAATEGAAAVPALKSAARPLKYSLSRSWVEPMELLARIDPAEALRLLHRMTSVKF